MADWKWDEKRQAWRKDLWLAGRRTKLTFKGTKRDAQAYEAQRRLELAAEPDPDSQASPAADPFALFCVDTYTPHAKATLRASTWGVRRYRLESLISFFGDTPLDEISTEQIEAYKQSRTTGPRKVDKSTCNSELNDLSAILSYARHLGRPCADVKILRYVVRKKKGTAKPYTRAEVEYILAGALVVGPHFHALVKFLAETGCRRSEAINLPRSRLDLDAGLAHIWSDSSGDVEDDEDEYEVKSADREVTLSTGLVATLREHLARVGESPWVFPVPTNRGHTKGERYASWPKLTWNRALAKATDLARKADPEARCINGGPHRLRHTYASLFLQERADLFALARVLGHSHTRVTELYAHLLPDHLAATRGVVVFEKTTPKTTPKRSQARGRTA